MCFSVWPLLFEADRDGNQSAFVECIRSLHLQEPTAFVQQLTAQIASEQLRAARAAGDSIDVVGLPLLFAAVAAVDPHRTPSGVAALIGAALAPIIALRRQARAWSAGHAACVKRITCAAAAEGVANLVSTSDIVGSSIARVKLRLAAPFG